jgi:hypothetical protein
MKKNLPKAFSAKKHKVFNIRASIISCFFYLGLTPWHESKRMPQFNLVEWAEVQHEIIPLSLKTLARQRYNQLKDIPKFAANLNRLRQMSLVQAENELKEIDFEKAKDVHPQKNCVIHAYVCVKDIQFLN